MANRVEASYCKNSALWCVAVYFGTSTMETIYKWPPQQFHTTHVTACSTSPPRCSLDSVPRMRAQFVLPDPAFPVDTLVTPAMSATDNVDTLVTKQFVAVSAAELQENLTPAGVAPAQPWGTTDLTSVRLAFAYPTPPRKVAEHLAQCWCILAWHLPRQAGLPGGCILAWHLPRQVGLPGGCMGSRLFYPRSMLCWGQDLDHLPCAHSAAALPFGRMQKQVLQQRRHLSD